MKAFGDPWDYDWKGGSKNQSNIQKLRTWSFRQGRFRAKKRKARVIFS